MFAHNGGIQSVLNRCKGFQAVKDNDWTVVALAWFQDTLNHEPDDAGLKRLVDLEE